MPSYLGRFVISMLAVLALAGCTTPLQKKGTSLLAPAQMSPDSCVLDVFFIRVPFGDPKANDELWQDIDEQHFSADLRQRLMHNGFRAGVVSGQIPIVLSNLLELSDKPAPNNEVKGADLTDVGNTPRVMRRHMQVRAGRPSEIIASRVYDELPVLVYDSGQLNGETYSEAQGIFNLKAVPLPDGRVRVNMSPEVHHNQPRQRWIADQGMMRLDSSRPKRVFDDLALSATLSPGGMLVVSGLSNLSGSLGYHFFTENEGRLEQKVLVIRLAQTQHDDLFLPSAELPLE